MVDHLVFKAGKLPENKISQCIYFRRNTKEYPKSYLDIKGIVTSDYQKLFRPRMGKLLRSKISRYYQQGSARNY